MDLLLNPEKWMETPVATVAAAMTEQGVRKLQLAVGKFEKPMFALIIVSGEDTQDVLDAIADKERELDDTPLASQVDRQPATVSYPTGCLGEAVEA